MNILLVDDHALFREGLRALLANISPGLVIHEASSVEGAAEECRATEFRMVLLDLGLSDTGGLETLVSFRESVPHVPVVVLSGEQQAKHIRAAIEKGAVGFIPKSHTSLVMIAALRLVLSGGVYLPRDALDDDVDTASLEASSPAAVAAAFARLTPRQQTVADMLLKGCSNKVIARELVLSEGTIKTHVSAIFQILGARNRVEAFIIAAKSGIKVM
jgi:DNA-binding NarL/FixJ family response regulator